MKKLLLILLFTIATFAQGINWMSDITKAQELAKKDNKIILVFIEAEHCPWCKRMLNDTLSTKDVVRNVNKDYIALKLDADDALTQKYFGNVAITPTTYFYSPNGEPLEALEGYQNEEFFFWAMSRAENKFKELNSKK